MTEIIIPDALPQLYIGKHDRGTGRACIMNAVAYMKGDAQISDMPGCVWPPFAKMAQIINDHLCTHLTEEVTNEPIIHTYVCDGMKTSDVVGLKTVHKLCGPCAHQVWMMGVPLIGTSELFSGMIPNAQRAFMLHMGLRIVGEEWPALTRFGSFDARTLHGIVKRVQGIAYGGGHEILKLNQIETDASRHAGPQLSALIQMAGLKTPALVQDCLPELITSTFRRGRFDEVARMKRQLATFVDWMHQAAGQETPRQYTVTEEDVAKVPVMAA